MTHLDAVHDRFSESAGTLAELEESRRERLREQLRPFVAPTGSERVLDAGTGTGALAFALAPLVREVVGVDVVPEMLAEARRRLPRSVRVVEGRAERLPFPDASFDALTFTYLLRYVDDPAATLAELARVVRPGGRIASLEFLVPPLQPARALWELYVRLGLPLLGRAISPAWGEVGRFLGPSIRGFYARYPLERQLELWREAGVGDVRFRRLSLGGGIVIWGRRG